jgi:CDP-glucose 4,6-dehydratase
MAASPVLVTGARGFIASWLCRRLLADGRRAFDRESPGDSQPGRHSGLAVLGIEDEVEEVRGDLRDADSVGRIFDQVRPDLVFHLAAQTIVGTAVESPAETFDVNVRGTWTVLEAAREREVAGVVFASSDKAYGAHQKLPYTEDFALQPTAPYEASKAAADLIARSYWDSFGLPVGVTRFANVYGGGDINFSRLVPETVSAVLDGRRPVLRSDGSPQRDLLYVEDAATAYLAVADAVLDGTGAGMAFNAGGERPYTVLEIVETIARVAGTGIEPDVQGEGNPRGEIDRQYVDSTRLREMTGWRPEFSLEHGLRQTLEWYRDNPEVRASVAVGPESRAAAARGAARRD